MELSKKDPAGFSREELDAELAQLRALKDSVRERLVVLVREYDKRARLAKVEAQFPGLVQQITGVGGVKSAEAHGNLGNQKKDNASE